MRKSWLQVGLLFTSPHVSCREELKNFCCTTPSPLPKTVFVSLLKAMRVCLQSLPRDLPEKRGFRNTALLHIEKSKITPRPPIMSLFPLLCPSIVVWRGWSRGRRWVHPIAKTWEGTLFSAVHDGFGVVPDLWHNGYFEDL